MANETMDILNVILIISISVCVIPMIMFVKMMRLTRYINRLLIEVKSVVQRHSSVALDVSPKGMFEFNTCKYCRHRMSFIQITEETALDNFYYKCKLHKKDIALGNTCMQFERDLTYKK